jgi:hypothetical protein
VGSKEYGDFNVYSGINSGDNNSLVNNRTNLYNLQKEDENKKVS